MQILFLSQIFPNLIGSFQFLANCNEGLKIWVIQLFLGKLILIQLSEMNQQQFVIKNTKLTNNIMIINYYSLSFLLFKMKNQTQQIDPIYEQSKKPDDTVTQIQLQKTKDQLSSDQFLQIIHSQGHSQSHNLPKQLLIPNSLKVQKIACGISHIVVLTESGSVLTCGNNQYNQLGYHTKQKDVQNMQTVISYGIKDISCGSFHTVAYNQKQAYSWGDDRYGALGYEKNIKKTPRKIPFLLSFDEKITKVYCGANNTIIKVNQSLYGFGENNYGKLGLLIKKNYYLPELLEIANQDNMGSNLSIVTVKIHEKSVALLSNQGTIFIAGQFGLNKYSFQNGFCKLNFENPEHESGCNIFFSDIAYLDEKQLIGIQKQDNQLYIISELKIHKVSNILANATSLQAGNNLGIVICDNNDIYCWGIKTSQLSTETIPFITHLPSQNNVIKDQKGNPIISVNQGNLILINKKQKHLQQQQNTVHFQQQIQLRPNPVKQTQQFMSCQTNQYKEKCIRLQEELKLQQEQIYRLKYHFKEEIKRKVAEAENRKQLEYLQLLQKKDSIIQKFTEHYESQFRQNHNASPKDLDIDKPMENIEKCLIHLKMIFNTAQF